MASTTRGFIGAALSNATHLFLFDIDAWVVHFNRVSALMLKAARDPNQYRLLTLNPQMPIEQFGPLDLDAFEMEKLKATLVHRDWHKLVNKIRGSGFWSGRHGQFTNANYLTDWNQFFKLKKMATEGRIQASLADFTDGADMVKLAKAIVNSGLTISVLDLSNMPDTTLATQLIESLKLLAPAMTPETLVVWTTLWGWTEEQGWPYFWSRMGDLSDRGIFEANDVRNWRDGFTLVACERKLRPNKE